MNEELLEAIGQLLDTKLDEKLAPMQADIAQLKEGQAKLEEGQKSLEKRLAALEESQATVINRLDYVADIADEMITLFDGLEGKVKNLDAAIG